jgi:hypothetical protein
MKVQGAVIKQPSGTFAVAVVKPAVLSSRRECASMQRELAPCFPGLPVVLMARDRYGAATYFGMADFVEFLSLVDPDCIPMKEYAFEECAVV